MTRRQFIRSLVVVFVALELSSGLDRELRKMRETYNKLKKEYDQAKEKLKFFEKVCRVVEL